VITPRQELVLRKVVETFTTTGVPVGSRVLAADAEIGAGPSTIRSELAILEEHGLLAPRTRPRGACRPTPGTASTSTA